MNALTWSAGLLLACSGCVDRSLGVSDPTRSSVDGATTLDGGTGSSSDLRDGGVDSDGSVAPRGDGGVGDAGSSTDGGPFIPPHVKACGHGNSAPPARMPKRRYDIGAASGSDGRIYLGNMGSDGNGTLAFAYDVTQGAYTQLADVPGTLVESSSPVLVNGLIYTVSSSLFAYTPGANTWAAKTSLVPKRVGTAATVAPDGKIYASGGVIVGTQSGAKNSFVYDPATDAWAALADRPVGDPYAGTATGTDGIVYVFGEHAVSLDPVQRVWTTLPDPPTPRVDPGIVAVRGMILDIGGRVPNAFGPSDVVEGFDLQGRTWSSVTTMPVAVDWPSVALACDGQVYVFGGVDVSGKLLDLVQVYDPDANTWQVSP